MFDVGAVFPWVCCLIWLVGSAELAVACDICVLCRLICFACGLFCVLWIIRLY